jgi:DNA invertase Pin-like site-specific DNA recombinase
MLTKLIPAAQYVRMSTDDQQFSIANQEAAISQYAKRNGFTIVQTYADPGRTGVVIKVRPGLRRLLEDVVSGRTTYKAILVYDISRWGRFQDIDEAGHYEFLCKRAGIPVHYCAEMFPNDGTMSSSILKALKRTMAGEYSRELGVKVFEGKKRIVLAGFRVGGAAGCGFRRLMVSKAGIPKQLLEKGEYKNLHDDRIILVPGPKWEIQIVRLIYRMALNKGMGPTLIARTLNCQRRLRPDGRPWTHTHIQRLLRNPKYAGLNMWGRTTQRMHAGRLKVEPQNWLVSPVRFHGIVSAKRYEEVQRWLATRFLPKTDEQLLEPLRSILKRRGTICSKLMYEAGLDPNRYRRRFGSITKTYLRLGWRANATVIRRAELHSKALKLKRGLFSELQALRPNEVSDANKYRSSFLLNGRRVLVYMAQFRRTDHTGKPRWLLKLKGLDRHTLFLICINDPDYSRIETMYLKREIGEDWKKDYILLNDRHWWLDDAVELEKPGDLFSAVEQVIHDPSSNRPGITVSTRRTQRIGPT